MQYRLMCSALFVATGDGSRKPRLSRRSGLVIQCGEKPYLAHWPGPRPVRWHCRVRRFGLPRPRAGPVSLYLTGRIDPEPRLLLGDVVEQEPDVIPDPKLVFRRVVEDVEGDLVADPAAARGGRRRRASAGSCSAGRSTVVAHGYAWMQPEDVCLVVVLQIRRSPGRATWTGCSLRDLVSARYPAWASVWKTEDRRRRRVDSFQSSRRFFETVVLVPGTLSSPRVRIRGPAHQGGCSGRDPCYDVHGLTVKAMLPERPGRLAMPRLSRGTDPLPSVSLGEGLRPGARRRRQHHRVLPREPKIFRDGCPGAGTLSSPRVRIRGPAHEGGCSGRDPCYDVTG